MNRSIFLRQLRYWTFHCSLNALPSFCIALIYLQLWRNPSAIAAMFCAIGTFIPLYATLTSLNGTTCRRKSCAFPCSPSRSQDPGGDFRDLACDRFHAPDFHFAGLLVWGIGRTPSESRRKRFRSQWDFFRNHRGGGITADDFLPVFATTLLEGFILSFLLLMISFFSVMFVQARDRRNAFRELDPRRVNGI